MAAATFGNSYLSLLGFRRAAERFRMRAGLCSCAMMLAASCTGAAWAQSTLPDAPLPQQDVAFVVAGPEASDAADSLAATPGAAAGQQTFPPAPTRRHGHGAPGFEPSYVPLPPTCGERVCSQAEPSNSCCQRTPENFAGYLQQNAVHIYTPRELGLLAVHGIIDPFNLLTIGYTSAYTVATDSHSPFGPGIGGFAKLSGVALTQDMTSEFFGTFLIPSIDHQDPHYHRMPNASVQRRIAHCVYQVFWTDSDTGKGMVNYSTLFGAVADEAVGTAYVPYPQTGWGPSAARISLNWATAPLGNFITEFVPDVARHINLNVVFVQRIVNRVALEEGGGPSQ